MTGDFDAGSFGRRDDAFQEVGEILPRLFIRQGEMGYVVADNNPYYLAQKIALLLSRPNGNAESVNLMRSQVARFGWSNIAAALVEECEAVRADYFTREN